MPRVTCSLRMPASSCPGSRRWSAPPPSTIDGPRPPYKARDYIDMRLAPIPFTELLEMLGDSLFDPRTGRGSFVLYNVGPLAKVGKLDVIALAESPAAAERALEEEFPRRLGLT